MARVLVDGVEMSYYDSGAGFPLVFLHSFGHNKLMWSPQLSHFLDRGYRVVAPDFRGHGGSGFDPNDHTIEAMAKDVIRMLRSLSLEEVALVGISMGGYVALRMWALRPNAIKALVLSNTKAEADNDEIRKRRVQQIRVIEQKGVSEFINMYAPRRLSRRTLESKPWVLDFVKSMNSSIEPAALISTLTAMSNKVDDRKLLDTIHVPALIIAGSDDNLIPKTSASFMSDRIKTARLVMMEGTGHVSNLEDPVKYNQSVEEFFKSAL